MNAWSARRVIGPEFFQEGNVQNSFLKAYKGWIEICKAQRISKGRCDGCSLNGHIETGICTSFQSIGRALANLVPAKIHQINVDVSNMVSRSGRMKKEAEEFEDYMDAYLLPGSELCHSSRGTES